MDVKNLFKKLTLKKIPLLALFVAIISGGFFVYNAFASSTVTPAIGASAVSIDTTSNVACVGASCGSDATHGWTSVSQIVITEGVAGDITAGTHTLTLPAGWEFNQIGLPVSVNNTGAGLTLEGGWTNITPTANTITFIVATSSSTAPVILTISGIQVRPTGTVAPTSGNMTHSGAIIAGVDSLTSFGTFATVPGAATQVRVETLANGQGTVVPAQSITSDDSLTAHSITRDQFGNYISNAIANWTLENETGGVIEGDLIDNGINGIFNGNLIGSATMRATIDSLFGDSGTITITPGIPADVIISTQPAGVNSVDDPLTTQPIINVQDQHGNNVPGETVTAVLVTGTGSLRNATAVTDASGNATFSGFGYSKSGEIFTIKFTAGTVESVASTDVGSLAVGAIHDLTISPADSTITADGTQTYTATGVDQYGNALPDQTSLVTFTIDALAGGSFTGDDLNVYNAEFVGTWTVTGTSDSVGTVIDTAQLIVTPGVITHLDIIASPSTLSVNTNSIITVSAHDQFSNVVTYDNTTRVHLTVDNGNLANAGLTLTAGVATTTVTNSVSNVTLVSVIDLTNTAILDDEIMITFTAIGAPVISDVSEKDISQSGVTINFTSDRAGKSRIDYGTTTSYGFSTQYPAANNMTPNNENDITLGGLNCGTTYYYKIFAKSLSDVEETSTGSFDTLACPVAVIPTIVLNGPSVVSAYSATEANARFETGVQFTVTNDASVTVNGTIVTSVGGIVTAASNAQAKTLGAHVYNVVVTSSTGNTAEITVGYQVNADSIVPVIPTISLIGDSIVSTYILTDANTRFTSGLQFTVGNNASVTVNGAVVVPDGATLTAALNAVAKTLGAHTYNVVVISSTGHTVEMTVSYQVNADNVTPIYPTIVLNGPSVVSAYSVTEANARFETGVQFTVTNDASVTVNGTIVASVDGIVTAASNAQAKTLGAHVYNVVVTSSTGNTAEITVAYQVNADDVTPVIPTISLIGDSIVSTYVLTAVDTRFETGLQFTVGNNLTVTVNGAVVVPDGATLTAASNDTAKTLGAHTYHVVVTSSTGHTAEMTVSYQVNADDAPADITSPTFVDQLPVAGTIGASINPELYVSFDEPLDSNTISSDSVKLCLVSDTTCASPISIGSPILTEGGTRIRLGGSSVTLSYNTAYWIQVTADVTDLAGNPIAAYGSIEDSSFTTTTAPVGELAIGTAVMIKSDGLADDSYENGWEWKLRITLPTNENAMALKFANWISGVNTLLAGGNMQYYSEQIDAGTGSVAAPVEITTANTYPDNIVITNDADLSVAGIQTDIHIQVKIPTTTVGGSYSSAFAVQSESVIE